MTEIAETPEVVPEELPIEEPVVLVRRVEISAPSSGDGRTLDLRIVPYNTVADVSDPPHFIPYKETWLPGAFARQMKAANRVDVLLNVEHEQGFGGVVGHGVEFHDAADALYGAFRVLKGADGDKALELVNAGVLTGVSLEFNPMRSVPRPDGVIARVNARLDKVALARRDSGFAKVAYKEAGVLAVRNKPTVTEPVLSAEIDKRLARVGYEKLQRLTLVERAWDGSASRFTDEEYERACLVCRRTEGPVKERFSLPVLEPNGELNVNALGVAAAVLSGARGGLSAPRDLRAEAARKLIRYYRMAAQTPPPSLVALAQA